MAAETTGETDVMTAAAAAGSTVDVALLLRQLRQRDARARDAAEQSHHDLAAMVGCSPAAIGFYLSGVTLPPRDHLDTLARSLGATADERRAVAAAHERVSRASTPGRTTTVVPQSLPPAPAGFVGRASALAELDAAIERAASAHIASEQGPTPGGGREGPLLVSVVTGMGGVGKTALALHWAYRSVQRFPDGQLFVNLRGYDPGEPMSVGAALQVLLAALDVPAASLPSNVDERAALYRELLAGRRVLVIVDNAASSEQVRALLPPAPGVALVTSRDGLCELVNQHGAHRMTLDALPEEDAAGLLRGLVGERCDQEPQAVRSVLQACGRLPLALRVAAEIATARPKESLTELLAEIGPEPAGLEPFETGDVRSDLREVFSWSLRSLPAPVARSFRLLGLAPVEVIDAYGLAALAGTDPHDAEANLDALARAHLVAPARDSRYRLHDLLRAYAVELAGHAFSAEERRSALHRQFGYYLATALAAMDVRFPYRLGVKPRRPPEPLGEAHTPPLSTPELASAWLAAERTALVRLTISAHTDGWPEYAVALAFALATQFDGEYADDALGVFEAAHAAAADEIDRAHLHHRLGTTYSNLGQLDEAAAHFERAIATFEAHGDSLATGPMISGLGILCALDGRFDEARGHLQQAQRLMHQVGRPDHEAITWANLATLCMDREDWEGSEECGRNALASMPGPGRPQIYVCLARAAEGQGRYDEATTHALAGLDVANTYDNAMAQLLLLAALASVDRRRQRPDEAAQNLENALQAYRRRCRTDTVVRALNTLAEIYLDAGSPSLAKDRYTETLRLAERVRSRLQVARALLGLGDAHAALGEPILAQSLWRESLTTYEAMSHPAAQRVAQRLRG